MKSPVTILKIVFGASLLMLFVIFKGNIDQWISCNLALDNSFVVGFYAERIVYAQFLFVAAVLGLFFLWLTQYKIVIADRHFLLSFGVTLFYLLAYRLFPDALEFELLTVGESGICKHIYFADLVLLSALLVIVQFLLSRLLHYKKYKLDKIVSNIKHWIVSAINRKLLHNAKGKLDKIVSKIRCWIVSAINKAASKEDKNEILDASLPYKGLLFDKPLGSEDADELGYKTYAEMIGNRIVNTPLDECSFAIGLNGKWGIGKTSLLKMILAQIEKEEPQTITIEFDPWTNKNSDQIITDFFNTLKDKLSKYHTGVSDLLDQYANKIAGAGFGELSKFIELFRSNRTIADLKKEINTSIKEIGKRVVIIIDDLDRLDKKEVVEVLKLIRNNGDFHNTFYLAAYDKSYLKEALKELNQHESETFLEKIFQVEYKLPLYPESAIQKLLERKLIELLVSPNNSVTIDEIYSSIKRIMISDLWHNIYITPRDVIRLVNSVSTNIQNIKNEVNMEDFLLIEILRLKYPEIHSKLIYNRMDVLEIIHKTHFETKEKIDQKEDEILKAIFPRNKRERDFARNSVALVKSYHKYFSYNVFPNEIPLIDYLSLFDIKTEDELNSKIESICLDEKIEDLIYKLGAIKLNNEHDDNIIKIKILFQLGEKYLEPGKNVGKQIVEAIEDLLSYETTININNFNTIQLIKSKIGYKSKDSCMNAAFIFNEYKMRLIQNKQCILLTSLNIDPHFAFYDCLTYYLNISNAFDNNIKYFIDLLYAGSIFQAISLKSSDKKKLFNLIRNDLDAFIIESIKPIYANNGDKEIIGIVLESIVQLIFGHKSELMKLLNKTKNSTLKEDFKNIVSQYPDTMEITGYIPSNKIGKTILFLVKEKFKGNNISEFDQVMMALEEF